jgi:hypothetical protein
VGKFKAGLFAVATGRRHFSFIAIPMWRALHEREIREHSPHYQGALVNPLKKRQLSFKHHTVLNSNHQTSFGRSLYIIFSILLDSSCGRAVDVRTRPAGDLIEAVQVTVRKHVTLKNVDACYRGENSASAVVKTQAGTATSILVTQGEEIRAPLFAKYKQQWTG